MSSPSSALGTGPLAPLAFQEEMVRHLKAEEPGLWKWFASSGNRAKQAEAVRLDLLKTTYRIERDTQPALYRMATEIAGSLGITAPITFYQAQTGGGMNAGLAYLPGEMHILFSGPVVDALSEVELRALLGHEAAHYLLFDAWEGDFLVAADLLRGLCQEVPAAPAHLESLRLFNLYGEVFADRGALFSSADPAAALTALLKIETGLAEVSAESYLRQADEIFSKGDVQADQLTHPEPYIRARALHLWSKRGKEANGDIIRMIEGPWSLERIDLTRQRRLRDATRQLFEHFLAPAWLRTESILAHARLFFADLGAAADPGTPFIEEMLAHAAPSLQDYVCYLLLDFITVDREMTEPCLAAALLLCQRLDLTGRFSELAQKELSMSKKQFAKVERDAAGIVARAAESV